jgi:hypothetical protein
MRTQIVLFFSLLILAGAASTQPSEPQQATTESSENVDDLIAQLGDPAFGVREQAEERLSDMGPSIEPNLQHALDHNPSDEARTRLKDLIENIEENRTLHASITMHYADAPVKKILDDFAAQSGSEMGINEPSIASFVEGRTASVDLDNAGFWQAMRVISDATGVRPAIGQGGLSLAPDQGRPMAQVDLDNPYAQISGGLLIVPRFGQENRMINYHGSTRTGTTLLVFDAIPEPKLHILSAMTMDWVKECIDDKGNSLLAPAINRRFIGRNIMIARGPQQYELPLQVNLQETPVMGTKIARLRGELNMVVQTHSQTYEIDDITRARDVSKSDNQMTVTVVSCSKMNLNYRVDLDCTGAAVNMGLQDFMNSVVLIDDQGGVIQRQSPPQQMMTQHGPGEPLTIRLIFIFQPTQRTPVKLRWEKTVDENKLMVPFEVDGLPLP